MPAPPIIRATVIDIQSDSPTGGDIFMVDTNVWYWFAYVRASQVSRPPALYQTTAYPSYVSAALTTGAALVRTGITLAELATAIEGAELDIYNIGLPKQVGKKAFRYDRQARRNVMRQIIGAWRSVQAASHIVELRLSQETTQRALRRLAFHPSDPSDTLVIDALLQQGIEQFLSDDADFAAMPCSEPLGPDSRESHPMNLRRA